MIAKSQNWQKTAIAVAATALFTFSSSAALALSLGRITVQSALGEPLRAEIDVPDINADEAASLKTAVALPEAFAAAGLEYNSALSGLQATLQRRADGRAFIRLTSERPINEPFVDMILEASWSSGRIVRDYTMLFDPPSLRKSSPVAPTLPQTPAPTATKPATAPVQSSTTGAPVAAAPARNTGGQVPVATKPPAPPVNAGEKRVIVQPGDTATRIAGNVKESGVSLDQMLVAMLRNNPDAFINNNIDRIRSGAVVNVPSTEMAKSVPAPEATRILRAESKDFEGFKRQLASAAPTSTVAAADRKTSGTIESKVVETKPKVVTPDKLTLSKGSVQAKSDEAQIAKERAEKEAATRAAEIAKNINDLKAASAAAMTASAPASVAPPATASSAPAPAAAAAPVVTTDTPAIPTPAVLPASAPAVAASEPKPAAAAAPVVLEEPSVVDELLDSPIAPVAGIGLLALLGGFAFWRVRERKKNAAQIDSSFLESRLQPDSFFGASGGQRVDTNSEGPASGSSMVYSASQLDAADDVDPVAEADVYLAYGRDVQAEEILKEAIRTNPGRLAIYTKLMEIYAKRRDAHSFEATAIQAHKLTGSDSPDWTRICEMGLGFDPSNPLYQPGGAPTAGQAAAPMAAGTSSSSFGTSTLVQPAQPGLSQGNSVDLDLDLDFSLDDEPVSVISDLTGGTMEKAAPVAVAEQTLKMTAAPEPTSDGLDFSISDPVPLEPAPSLPELSLPGQGMDLDFPTTPSAGTEFSATNTLKIEPASEPEISLDSGMLEFDMSSLSLDLESTTAADPTPAPDMGGDDPLETKLALAEEFVSIGDEDGARALIEEVVAEATGDMRIKAQRALANLS